MANTTIRGLGSETVYTKVYNSSKDAPLPVAAEPIYQNNNGGEFVLQPNTVLYVTVHYATDTASGSFVSPTPASLSWFKQTGAGAIEPWTDSSVAKSVTYFVPYMPDVLQYSDITLEVASAAGASAPTSAMSTISSGSTSASTSSATRNSALNLTDPAVIAFSSSVSTDVAAAASSSALHDKGERVGKSEAVGAAVGGSIGGLIVGIAIALIALTCLRRRESHGSEKDLHRSRLSDGDADTRGHPMSKEMQTFATPTTVTGWQKHLPQEKDDGTITKAVKTIFDQIQIHVEGFYNSKSRKLTASAAAALERVSPDGLSRKMSKAPGSLPLLEAILIRLIVHRISLRSDAGESFLPFEYTKIPEQNNWHMESDEGYGGQTEEPKKGQSSLAKIPLHNLTDPGFPQAFSQWRVLTAFLLPDPRADQAFKKHLDVKIDLGVRALTDAFAPWDIPGRSITNRNESLRRILQLASDAGLMLFAQPSTFVFDWSSRQGTVTVTPALVKRLGEAAEPLPSPVVLIAAKQVDA
jgi:hypothetical protein